MTGRLRGFTAALVAAVILSLFAGPNPGLAFDLSDEESGYVAAVSSTLQEVGENLTSLSALLQNPQVGDAAWEVQVAGYLVSFQAASDEAQAIDPPERLEDAHATYLELLGLLDGAAADFIAGYDANDPTLLNQSAAKLEEAGTLLDPLLEAIAAVEAEELGSEPDTGADDGEAAGVGAGGRGLGPVGLGPVGLGPVGGGSADEDSGEERGGRAVALAATAGATCADFDAYEWAQTVYDADPDENEALDLDGDGIACPELPAGGAAPALWVDGIPARTAEATLVDVIDGDTIKIETQEGETETVRLIGVDTPETRDPRRPVQCFGAEATAFTSLLLSLVPDGTVYVERDVTDRDRYGRLLRYVWLDIGGEAYLLNEAIARSGYGDSSAYPPDVKYQDRFDDGERFAREYQLGLWQACGGPDVPIEAAQPAAVDPIPAAEPRAPAPEAQPEVQLPAPVPEPAPPPAAGCDPSYPGVCIPSPPPDLDCGQVDYGGFAVVPPDPHGFDGDGDGVGCE